MVSRECPPVSDHLDHDMTNNWNTPQQKPDKCIFIVHHLTVVLLPEKGACPEDSQVSCYHIKLAFFLTFHMFGS